MDFADNLLQSQHVSRYKHEVQNAQEAELERIAELTTYKEECSSMLNMLETLPCKLEHKIMVPFGKHAFFPGYLYHTNELMVEIGSGYRVQCSAHHASEVLQRRCAYLDDTIAKAQRQVESLDSRIQTTQLDADGEEPTEIRHSLEESDALLASASTSMTSQPRQTSSIAASSDESFTKLMQQLQELARQEDDPQSEVESLQDCPSSSSVSVQDDGASRKAEMLVGVGDSAGSVDTEHMAASASQFQQIDLDDIFEDTSASPVSAQQPAAFQGFDKSIAVPSSARHTWKQSQAPHKPALKKGFLLSSKPVQSQNKPPKQSTSTSGTSTSGDNGVQRSNPPRKAAEEAFTGQVLERMPLSSTPASLPTASPASIPTASSPGLQKTPPSSNQVPLPTSVVESVAQDRSPSGGASQHVIQPVGNVESSSGAARVMDPDHSNGRTNVGSRAATSPPGGVMGIVGGGRGAQRLPVIGSDAAGGQGQGTAPKKMSKFKQRALGLSE